jgi:hypothetical protein
MLKRTDELKITPRIVRAFIVMGRTAGSGRTEEELRIERFTG